MKHFAKVVMAQTKPKPMQRIGVGGESLSPRYEDKMVVQDTRRQLPPRCRQHCLSRCDLDRGKACVIPE